MGLIDAARRKARGDLTRFAALIDTPGNLLTGVKLPGNGKLLASTSSVLAVPTVLVNVNAGGRDIGIAAGAANKVHALGGFERGRTVTKKAGAPGTVSIYVADGFGRPVLIAQG